MRREDLVIWGASGHALVVADIIRLCGRYRIVGFIDNVNPSRWGTEFSGLPILGGEGQLDQLASDGVETAIIGFGNCAARLRLADLLRTKGFRLATAIHPSAVVARDAQVGEGTVIAAGAVVSPAASVGRNVVINTSASVDHESVVEDGAHICPGTHLAGRVRIGRGSWIGIGATVIDGVTVGSSTLIGAGAVVTRDIPDGVVAYGVPARIIRRVSGND